MAKAKLNISEIITDSAKELLTSLGVSGEVKTSKDDNDVYQVVVSTDESGLLIGFHGETLSSFQIILGLVVHKKAGEWVKISVEVGDYKAKQEEQLTQMAASYADRVISSGEPLVLTGLSANERRIIHSALQGHSAVETFSEGEGLSRHLVIRLKTS